MQIIGNNLIRLQDVDSTNNYAANLLNGSEPPEGTVILAYNQFGGKGQRGAVWTAEPGANLTLSIIIYPKKIEPQHQFDISKMAAVALADTIDELTGLTSQIKWPNDILVNGKKVAGILIENSMSGRYLSTSIIGTGLNVNQRNFEGLPRASSLLIEGGRELDLEKVLEKFLSLLDYYYMVLIRGNLAKIESIYQEKLFRKGVRSNFILENVEVNGVIKGVQKNGRLEVEFPAGHVLDFDLKEIELLY